MSKSERAVIQGESIINDGAPVVVNSSVGQFIQSNKARVEVPVYVHFSFKRPKGAKYGLFAVAMYADKEYKRLMGSETRAFKLWVADGGQYATAIQALEHALYSIWRVQKQMMENKVNKVYLVTDNSILANWVLEPHKNKKYADIMDRAIRHYLPGMAKEIMLPIGLVDVVDAEKAYKFCRADLVINKEFLRAQGLKEKGVHKTRNVIEVEDRRSILDIVQEDSIEIKGADDIYDI